MAKVLLGRVTWRSTTLVLLETLLILGTVLAVAFARLGLGIADVFGRPDIVLKALPIAFACQICLYYGELYDDLRLTADRRELLARVLQALGVTSVILAIVYYLFPYLAFDRIVFPLAAVGVGGLVIGWRMLFSWLSAQVGPNERLLLVGTSIAAQDLARELTERVELGARIVGFVDPQVTPGPGNSHVIGTIEDIPAIVRAHGVDRVVVSLADARGKLPMDKLLDMKLEGVTFDHLASVYEEYTGKIAVENLRPSWLIFSAGFKSSRVTKAAKRAADVAIALIGIVVSAPLIGILALAIKMTSRGPVFYSQDRVGQHGRVFKVRKLRSMRQDAEAGTGPVWSSRQDDRITPIGRFLRSTRLDELPQFWCVLIGHMSFVGPRPERPEFVQSLTREIPFYGLRHAVKPGITGWAQVRYTYGASVEDAMQKLQFDLFYIKHMSLPFDVFILFETLKTVLLRKGV
jgi:sugar transferase (PEP-CTERM system associated)